MSGIKEKRLDKPGTCELNSQGRTEVIAAMHLPGLFEFFEFYKVFLPLYFEKRNYFYEWLYIASVYGAPSDCLWGGGRVGTGEGSVREILPFFAEYGISARLTFSNSKLREEHLADRVCNRLCSALEASNGPRNGVIIHSDLLLNYLRERYPGLYFVSSTTKVLTDFDDLKRELVRDEFSHVVPDFRLNKRFDRLSELSQTEKDKVEFLCNECCYVGCRERRECYENVSLRVLGEEEAEHICTAPGGSEGYRFSTVMKHPMFISADDIKKIYLPAGFTNFKIEGRELGSAVLLEMLLHYLVKPEHWLEVREAIYLDSSLNLF